MPCPDGDISVGVNPMMTFARTRPDPGSSLMSIVGVATHSDDPATVTRRVRFGRTYVLSRCKFVGSILSSARPLSGAGISKACWPVAHQREPSPNATLVAFGNLAAAAIRQVVKLIRMRSSTAPFERSNVPIANIESFPAATMLGPAPSVDSLRIRLTAKSVVEFGGVVEVLALDQETEEKVNADIVATVRTATLQVVRCTRTSNLSVSVSNATATLGNHA